MKWDYAILATCKTHFSNVKTNRINNKIAFGTNLKVENQCRLIISTKQMFDLCLLEYPIIEKQNHKFIWLCCVSKYDVLALTETWLCCGDNAVLNELLPPGDDNRHVDRERRGWWCVALIYKKMHFIPTNEITQFELLDCVIKVNKLSTRVVEVYRHPQSGRNGLDMNTLSYSGHHI